MRTADQLRTLPLNDPGVYSTLAITPMMSFRGGTYTFAGSKLNQSQFAIDGTSMSDGVNETPIGPLANYIESFKEVKIDIANNSAESASLGQVTIVSKSGTNRFAGAVFDYYQSPILRVKNPFSMRRASGVIHFPGLALGGPAVIPRLYDGRGRTFWFVSGETVNGSSASTDLNPTVPLEAWRRGDFSALGIPIRNPLTGEVYADGRIPQSALNPVSLRLQDRFYPLPNTGSNTALTANNYRETVDTGPIEALLRDRPDRSQLRRQGPHLRALHLPPGDQPGLGRQPAGDRDARAASPEQGAHLLVHADSRSVADQRAQIRPRLQQQPDLPGRSAASSVVDSLGLRGLAPGLPDIGGILKVSFPGTASPDCRKSTTANPGFLNRIHQIQDQVTWLRGTHSLKFGTDIRRVDYEEHDRAGEPVRRRSTSPGRFTGHPYADFLLGLPNTALTRVSAGARAAATMESTTSSCRTTGRSGAT